MPTKIVVPELGESIVEATVARWLKQEGEEVAVGEAVVELETDKVNLEVSAEQAGVLASIERQEGEDVEIGDVLGTIDESADGAEKEAAGAEEEEKPEEAQAKDAEKEGEEEKAPAPEKEEKPEEAQAKDAEKEGEEEKAPAPEKEEKPEEAQAKDAEKEGEEEKAPAPEKEEKPEEAGAKDAEKEGEEKATPVAQRLAQEHGLELAAIPARSGDRISKEDVERYLEKQSKPEGPAKKEEKEEKREREAKETQEAEPAPEQEPRPAAEETEAEPQRERAAGEERIRMSRRRQTIAGRLVEAQQTAAMLTTFNEVDMSAVTALRRRRRAAFEERHGVRLGFMSFFVKAVIGALKQFPRLNAELDGNEIVLKHYYDIGMAVSADEGLVVPVIRGADRLTFAEIEQQINDYAAKAQNGRLSIPDLRGGTFTITNGGVFGSLLSTPILNLPQVGILGLHKIEKRPVVVDDEIVIRPMMYVALSYDHRLIDGAEAVQFLARVKTLIEDPETLLLEG